MQGFGLTPTQCAEVFASGDTAYFAASGCANSQANDSLITQKKDAINTKTALIIGGGILAAGLIIYFSLKK